MITLPKANDKFIVLAGAVFQQTIRRPSTSHHYDLCVLDMSEQNALRAKADLMSEIL